MVRAAIVGHLFRFFSGVSSSEFDEECGQLEGASSDRERSGDLSDDSGEGSRADMMSRVLAAL